MLLITPIPSVPLQLLRLSLEPADMATGRKHDCRSLPCDRKRVRQTSALIFSPRPQRLLDRPHLPNAEPCPATRPGDQRGQVRSSLSKIKLRIPKGDPSVTSTRTFSGCIPARHS